MPEQIHPIRGTSSWQTVPIRVPFRFTLAGSSNPSVMSSNIESVTRFSTQGGEGAYRVKLKASNPIDSVKTVAWVDVTAKDTENLSIKRGQGLTNSSVAASQTREFDVVIRSAGTATNSLDGNVVSGELIMDQVSTVS